MCGLCGSGAVLGLFGPLAATLERRKWLIWLAAPARHAFVLKSLPTQLRATINITVDDMAIRP